MKSTAPTLKKTAAALGIAIPREGDFTAVIGGMRVFAFTGSSWQRRSIRTVRVFPRKNRREKSGLLVPEFCSISDVAKLTRELAIKLGFPVTGEFNRILFTAAPDGSLSRTSGRSGYWTKPKLP